MRFAKLNRLRIGGKNKGGSASGNSSFWAASLIFLFGLAFSFYLAFPDNILRARIVHEFELRLPVQVELSKATLSPLLTVSGERLNARLNEQPATVFEIDDFQVNPAWLSTFSGDPGVDGGLTVGGGDAAFQVTANGSLSLEAAKLPLERCH